MVTGIIIGVVGVILLIGLGFSVVIFFTKDDQDCNWAFGKPRNTNRLKSVIFKNLPFKCKRWVTGDREHCIITFPNKYKYKVFLQKGVRKDGTWSYTNVEISAIGNVDSGVFFEEETDLLIVYNQLETIKYAFEERNLVVRFDLSTAKQWDEIEKQICNLHVLKRKNVENE
jgi:hypothetical protein